MSAGIGPEGVSETQTRAVVSNLAVVVENVKRVRPGRSTNIAIRMAPGKALYIESMYAATAVDAVASLLVKVFADAGDTGGGSPLIVKSRILGEPSPEGITAAVDVTMSGSEELYFTRHFTKRVESLTGYVVKSGADFIIEVENEDNQRSEMDIVIMGYIFNVNK